MSRTLSPEVQAVLRAATISEDGLTLTLAGELDRKLYQATAKAIEALGGKWNRKAGAHLFTSDVRQILAGVLDGDKLPDKNPLDFYPTPEPVVLEMLKRIWPWQPGSRFLEPSAGEGFIADLLQAKHGVYADCVELDENRAQTIRKKGYPVVASDFLTFTPEQPYDYVLMNPPFTAEGDPQAYITHIEHALTCLRPGGELLAVVPQGYAYSGRKRVTAFRDFCEANLQSPTDLLAPGVFKASGTDIATCLIHITKPEEAAMPVPTEQPAKKTRKSSKKAAPAEAEKQPVTTEYMPGDFVICQVGGQTINSGITGLHVGTPLRFDVVNRNGPSTIPQSAITCRDDYSPVAPVRVGDLVTLRFRQGEVFKVIEPAGADEVVALENIADLHDRPSSPLSGLRVTRRVNIADLYADLSLPLPSHLQAAVSESESAVVEPELQLEYEPGDLVTVTGSRFRDGAPIAGVIDGVLTLPDWMSAAQKKKLGADEIEYGVDLGPDFPDDQGCTVYHFRASLLTPRETEESGPTALPTSTPILDGSSQSLFRVEQLVASPLNPRKFFDPAAVEELAESILHKGLMQNLVGRVAENGQDVEVVAGGRRLRALQLLAEQGRIPADYLVPVRVQPLTDLEALQLATAENVERRNMTPIEEADAFAQMVALGATPGDIALRFGYGVRTVQQRLVLAEGLGEDGRELFNSGQIGLEQAQVIAQTSGPLRQPIVAAAKRGVVASGLRSMIQSGTFLVEHAKFDVTSEAASKLEVVEDLFGAQPPRFADPKGALALQIEWAEARAKTLRGKKEQHFVDLKLVNSPYLNPSYEDYRDYGAPKELRGTVIMLSTITGEIREIRTCRAADIKSHEAKQQAEQRKQAASEASGSEGGAIRKSGWVDGHTARATALRGALVGDHKRTVGLTILSILRAEPVTLRASLEHVQAVSIPTGIQRLKELDAKLGGALKVNGHHTPKHPVGVTFGYSREGEAEYQFLQTLLTLTLEELLDLQGVLIAQAVGGWSEYNPMHAPYPFVTRLAADVGAKVTFKLTDDHLKAYPRDRLLELAADASIEEGHGLAAEHLSKLATNKDIRAAILQHADELHARGYVPPLARFPEVAGPDPADAQYRADALALLPRLSERQVGDLLEDLGHDPTDQDAAADALALVRQEIEDMDAEELREWAALKRMAKDLGPDATATAAD